MSRTDKHRPSLVQIKDPFNRGFLREVHNHQRGVCDLEDHGVQAHYGWRHWGHCYITESTHAYYTGRMWPKSPRKGGWGRPKRRDGKARASLRQLAVQTRKIHRAGVPCWCGGCDGWEDALPDWGACEPTQQWLWHKQG